MSVETLPLEILEVIFSVCDLRCVVSSREVCFRWNQAALSHLATLRVVYVGNIRPDTEVANMAPWLDMDELKTFKRTKFNTIMYEPQEKLDMEKLIRFVSKYFVNIEAFVADYFPYLPFELLAELLGPKLRFFSGGNVYDWKDKGYDILSKFTKLEKYPPSFPRRSPSIIAQLQHKLPIGTIGECQFRCKHFEVKRLLRLSLKLRSPKATRKSTKKTVPLPCFHLDLESSSDENWFYKPLNAEKIVLKRIKSLPAVNSSFALNIKQLILTPNHPASDGFYFPNLRRIVLSENKFLDQTISSLAHSPKLQRVSFLFTNGPILCNFIDSLPKVVDLQVLDLKCTTESIVASGPFCKFLMSHCPNLEALITNFSFTGTRGSSLAHLIKLKYFKCHSMQNRFIFSYFSNLHPNGSKKLTFISERKQIELKDPDLHELMHTLHRCNRITKLTSSFFVLDCPEDECLIKQMNSSDDLSNIYQVMAAQFDRPSRFFNQWSPL